ncbi:MAG: hypothetical protein VX278_19615 [Myxococcota bacterium]|nr:hypothetical protein [Myxococcota bacterium]
MLFFTSFFLSTASAQSFYVRPQIRVGVGGAWTDESLGISVSMDTRMTQIIYISVGGFRSLQEAEITALEDDIQSWTKLRSGIWAAPGLRFPHRYKKGALNWDFLLRAGFACVFSDLAENEDWTLMEPAALGGGDLIIFKDQFAMTLSGKMFAYNPYIREFREKAVIYRPQLTIEFSHKW